MMMVEEEKTFHPRALFRRPIFTGRRRPSKRPRRRSVFQPAARMRRRNQRTAGFLGIELKFYDQSLIDSALTSPTAGAGGEHDPSGTVLLNTVTQGDGEQQRDGRKIMMKSISVVGVIEQLSQANQAAGFVAPNFFVALVLDKQTNGATINSEDVYINPGGNAITATSPLRNLQQISRFKVLKLIKLVAPLIQMTYDGTNIEVGGYTLPFRMDVKLEVPVTYSASTETVANIVDNSLHVIAYASNIGGAPQMSYNSRLRFVG